MKKIIVVALVLAPAFAMAQLATKPVYNCSYWSYNQTAGGYVCGSYPMVEYVVDGNSLTYKIQQLEARIAELERKVNGQ